MRDNEWVQGAATAKRPTRWWVALLVGIVFVVLLVGTANGIELDEGADEASFAQQLVSGGLGGLLLILAIFAWVRCKEGRPIRTLGFGGPRIALRFVGGLVLGAAMFTLTVMSMTALGGVERVDVDSDAVGSSALGVVLVLGLVWFLQATAEEVVFRGFMFPPAALQLPVVAAFLAPSIVFALLHSAGEGAGPLPLINVGLFAVAATVIALADRGLVLIMGIHTGWNWFQGNVFGIPVSGEPVNENTIFRLAPVAGESKAISGGGFGIEATIGTTVIWLVLLVTAVGFLRARGTRTASGSTPAATG